MVSTFREPRNVELSLLYYLETSLASDWTGVTVLKTFKDVYSTSVALPIICARVDSISTDRKEIGSTTLENRYMVIIDVFTRSEAQRLDLSDYVKNKLKDGWTYYLHSHVSGDPTTLDRTSGGQCIVTEFIDDSKLDFGQEVHEKDKYRQSITVRVRACT